MKLVPCLAALLLCLSIVPPVAAQADYAKQQYERQQFERRRAADAKRLEAEQAERVKQRKVSERKKLEKIRDARAKEKRDLLIERQNNMQQIVVPLTVERINWLQTGEQRLNVAEFTTTNRDRLLCVGYT